MIRLAAAAFAVVTATAMACTGDGGDGSLTLEEYFTEFDGILDDHARRTENVEVDVAEDATLEERQEAFVPVFEEARDALGDLNR